MSGPQYSKPMAETAESAGGKYVTDQPDAAPGVGGAGEGAEMVKVIPLPSSVQSKVLGQGGKGSVQPNQGATNTTARDLPPGGLAVAGSYGIDNKGSR